MDYSKLVLPKDDETLETMLDKQISCSWEALCEQCGYSAPIKSIFDCMDGEMCPKCKTHPLIPGNTVNYGNALDIVWIYVMSKMIHRPKEPKIGYVYLLQSELTGYTKIGRTKNPKTRNRTISSFEKDLTQIALFYFKEDRVYESFEKLMHDKYGFKRKSGEWFDLTRDDILEIMDEAQRLNAQLITGGMNRDIRESLIKANFK